MVDDDLTVIQVLSKCLSGLGRLRFATDGEAALRLAREDPPDLLLLDAEMPGMSGFEVWEAMRAEPSLQDVPVIFVTSHSEEGMEEKGLALGAADFIAKPVRPAIVAARVRTQLRLKLAIDRLRRMATTDALTQCANRRVLGERLADEWSRAVRRMRPLSILMLDVDHFKMFNDVYGHLRGDEALIAVAAALRQSAIRPGDLVARYGGEEFALILPDTQQDGAMVVAAAVHEKLEKLQIEHRASERGWLSVSIGIASFDDQSLGRERAATLLQSDESPPAGMSVERLLAIADGALYAAKQAGRARSSFTRIDLPVRDPQ
uniref:GGDEF domain-containing response regulator n=1 Tax=Roseateles sp. TaxID=1971397 RepID=UPI0040368C51